MSFWFELCSDTKFQMLSCLGPIFGCEGASPGMECQKSRERILLLLKSTLEKRKSKNDMQRNASRNCAQPLRERQEFVRTRYGMRVVSPQLLYAEKSHLTYAISQVPGVCQFEHSAQIQGKFLRLWLPLCSCPQGVRCRDIVSMLGYLLITNQILMV